jgi:hypothetical protein
MRWRARALPILGLVFFLLTVTVATQETGVAGGVRGTRTGAELDHALAAWSGFPVGSSPRPLVALEGYVLNPDGGFPDDNSKLAFGNGEITAPASWPASPKSSMGFAITKASAAFTTLTASKSVLGSPPPLRTTGVALGSGLFLTDRGWQVLPAWLFSLSGVQNPAKVLAVAPPDMYSAPVTHDGESATQLAVTVTPGTRRIVVHFAGAATGTGPCSANYTLSLKESRQALAIVVLVHPTSADAVCAGVGNARHVAVVLPSPLGARVVVDATSDGAADNRS